MLAEIHGKISRSGSNLRTTSEDNLTGNVFGALRYAPFNRIMKKILVKSIHAKTAKTENEAKHIIEAIDADFWDDNIEFWPYHNNGELDACLKFENAIIGIEVKYNSPMSDGEDDISYDTDAEPVESKKQLAREAKIVGEWALGREPILILLAKKHFAKEITKTFDEQKIKAGVRLCYIGWEDFLESVKQITDEENDKFYRLILTDVANLLVRKGFEKFSSFGVLETLPSVYLEHGHYIFEEKAEELNKKLSFCFDEVITKEDYYEF